MYAHPTAQQQKSAPFINVESMVQYSVNSIIKICLKIYNYNLLGGDGDSGGGESVIAFAGAGIHRN